MNSKHNEWIFIAFAAFSIVFIILFAIEGKVYFMDAIVGLLFSGVYYLIQRRYPLKTWLVFLGFVPVFLNLVGLQLEFFAYSIQGVGYDKILHLVNSVALTILLYHWIGGDKKNIAVKIFIAALVVLGFGSFNEIVEFIGQRYFHIYGPGMFSQGDLLPSTLKNDLVNFDTWWDMIFNLLGTILASIIIIVHKSLARNKRGS